MLIDQNGLPRYNRLVTAVLRKAYVVYTPQEFHLSALAYNVTEHLPSFPILGTDLGWSCQVAMRKTFEPLGLDPCLAGSIRGVLALGWLTRRVLRYMTERDLVQSFVFSDTEAPNELIHKLDETVTEGYFRYVKGKLKTYLYHGGSFNMSTLASLCFYSSRMYSFVEHFSMQVADVSPLDWWTYVNLAWDTKVARKSVRVFYGSEFMAQPYPEMSVSYRSYLKEIERG